jgi:hypothetical protein
MVSLEERTPLKLLSFSVQKFRRKLSKNLYTRYPNLYTRYPNQPIFHKGCLGLYNTTKIIPISLRKPGKITFIFGLKNQVNRVKKLPVAEPKTNVVITNRSFV